VQFAKVARLGAKELVAAPLRDRADLEQEFALSGSPLPGTVLPEYSAKEMNSDVNTWEAA
jgi:hypothetical protein